MILWKYIKDHMQNHLMQSVGERGNYLTYEELIVYTEIFAKKLKISGCCAIYCRSELASVIALLGCFAAKATALPLSPCRDTKQSLQAVDLIRPACLVTDIDGLLGIYDIINHQNDAMNVLPESAICITDNVTAAESIQFDEQSIIASITYMPEHMKNSRTLCQVIQLLRSFINGERIDFFSGT